MLISTCLEHLTANTPDARARVRSHSTQATAFAVNVPFVGDIAGMWDFTTKPYAHLRPSGAPPG
jgi:hypothetical protein